jgi:hypothetical protein
MTPVNLSAYKESLQPFATVFFCQGIQYHYEELLEKLNLLTLYIRRHHSDALSL